jgi:hypothetical protein
MTSSIPQIDKLKEGVKKALEDESNRIFHIRNMHDPIRSLELYVRSLEEFNLVLSNQMAEMRKSR